MVDALITFQDVMDVVQNKKYCAHIFRGSKHPWPALECLIEIFDQLVYFRYFFFGFFHKYMSMFLSASTVKLAGPWFNALSLLMYSA